MIIRDPVRFYRTSIVGLIRALTASCNHRFIFRLVRTKASKSVLKCQSLCHHYDSTDTMYRDLRPGPKLRTPQRQIPDAWFRTMQTLMDTTPIFWAVGP